MEDNFVTNEELLSFYKRYSETKEVFIYLPNATLQGKIDLISPDFIILTKTENGEFVKSNNEPIKTLINTSHLIDISPVVKGYNGKTR